MDIINKFINERSIVEKDTYFVAYFVEGIVFGKVVNNSYEFAENVNYKEDTLNEIRFFNEKREIRAIKDDAGEWKYVEVSDDGLDEKPIEETMILIGKPIDEQPKGKTILVSGKKKIALPLELKINGNERPAILIRNNISYTKDHIAFIRSSRMVRFVVIKEEE